MAERQNKGLVSLCECHCVRYQRGPAAGVPWGPSGRALAECEGSLGGGREPVCIPIQVPGWAAAVALAAVAHLMAGEKPHIRGFNPLPRLKSSSTPHLWAVLATSPVRGVIVHPRVPLWPGAVPVSRRLAGQPLNGDPLRSRPGQGTAGMGWWEQRDRSQGAAPTQPGADARPGGRSRSRCPSDRVPNICRAPMLLRRAFLIAHTGVPVTSLAASWCPAALITLPLASVCPSPLHPVHPHPVTQSVNGVICRSFHHHPPLPAARSLAPPFISPMILFSAISESAGSPRPQGPPVRPAQHPRVQLSVAPTLPGGRVTVV